MKKRRSRIIIVTAVILLTVGVLAIVLLPGTGGGLSGTAVRVDTDTPPGTVFDPALSPTPTLQPAATATPTLARATVPPRETTTATPVSFPPRPTPLPPATATPTPLQPLQPILECVARYSDGSYRAFFGYRSENAAAVTVSIGPDNQFSPGAEDRGQPTLFQPGRTSPWPGAAYSVDFDGEQLTWHLMGNTASASAEAPICSYHIYFDKKWYNAAGELSGPPENLPPSYLITAQSRLGSAECTYPPGSPELVCSYANRSPALDDDGLWVQPGTAYSVLETGLPQGWRPFIGIGSFPGAGSNRYFTHVVDNREMGALPSPTPTEQGASVQPTATSPSPRPTPRSAPTPTPMLPPPSPTRPMGMTPSPLPSATAGDVAGVSPVPAASIQPARTPLAGEPGIVSTPATVPAAEDAPAPASPGDKGWKLEMLAIGLFLAAAPVILLWVTRKLKQA